MVTIYVLLCGSDKYYVGKTSNLNMRLEDHKEGVGSCYTQKYKPQRVVDTYPNSDNFDEDKYVLKYMAKYGIDNVRGGSFSQINLSDEQRRNIERMISGAQDRCFQCGKAGHFVKDCNSENKIIDNYFTVPKIQKTQKSVINVNPKPRSSWWDIGFRILDKLLSNTEDQCYRCGRNGHWANRCYARRDIHGKWLRNK